MARLPVTRKNAITGFGIDMVEAVLEQRSHAGPAEDPLGDDGAADDSADVERDDRGDRDERVAERVTHDDRALGEALGASGADVVLVHHLEQARPRVAGVGRERDQDERDGRQQQVGEQVDAVHPQRRPRGPGVPEPIVAIGRPLMRPELA